MLAAMAAFILNDTLVKLAAASMPPGEIMALRGLFASTLTICLVLANGHGRDIPSVFSPRVAIRALLEAAVAFLFIAALARLPLANITAIMQATPVVLTVMTVVLGIERVGWRRALAICVGFGGVLMIVRPSPSGFDIHALVALGAAFLVAGRDLVTRFVDPRIPSLLITLSTTLAVAAAGLVLGIGETWTVPAPDDLVLLAGAAALVTLGNFGIITAFRHTDVSVVSPFRYTIVIFSIGLGYAVFGDLPDALACLGILLIAGSGIYTIHRDHLTRRQAALATPPPPSIGLPRPDSTPPA